MKSRDNTKLVVSLLPLLPAIGIFVYLAAHLNFTQDDAYISYRYVANYLHGHGLVYNVGERIEGFTNFGWVIYLLLWGSWGVNFLLVSKITGYVLGGALVVISYLIAKDVLGEKGSWYAVLVAYLVGINQSVAYWSPAGLETAAFSVAVGLSIYWWLRRSWLLILGMVLSVWFRPEGAVVCGVLLIAEGIVERRIPKFALYSLICAFVLSLPLVGFKVGYYGGILPNPFYAKTSFHLDQMMNGLEYTWQFLEHYGFYGIGLIVPLLVYRKLTLVQRRVWWLVVGYMVYITLIGGDVLKVHRFYIPIVGVSALLAVLALWVLVKDLAIQSRQLALFLAVLVTLPLTWYLPNKTVRTFNVNEKRFVYKMEFTAREMKRTDPTSFSVATPTIGVFGYELLDHTIIDMLGLTDSTIARSSEPPIPGMATTWKEQRHNSKYLLEQSPDYIVFSTGVKPSAPAEKSLFLYKQFLDCYRVLGWYTPDEQGRPTMRISNVYQRVHPLTGDIRPRYPVQYVETMKQGMEAMNLGRIPEALRLIDDAIRQFPDTPSTHLMGLKG
ncbi:MAG: tetratricopeptide repeat protein, partial [candidate division Zixibacteria bacterium]|nr:tetratricopeptide repeat protein [candidate division Zixibacteria bacterium]